ncbi:Rne/Rng family ribonuclease [Intrasporangium sp.]|uniref:Rne/Rng family ribonuclease n=1 Tax=Intrasporangium sp. TaxID=1925024 RepID=UPI0033657529
MAPNETTPTESADEATPYAAELAPDAAAHPTGPAPRKRATRRSTKKAGPVVDAQVSSEVPTSDSADPAKAADAEDETVAPVRKRAPRKAAAPRKRATKKAAVEPSVEVVTGDEAATRDDAATRDEVVTSEALESVARTEASAGDEATATIVAETSEDEATEDGVTEAERPVVPSFSVLFQAPDTEAALSAPRRRRRAVAPAAAVPPRAPAARDLEEPEEPEDQADEARSEEEVSGEEDATPRRSRRRRGGKGRRGRAASEGDDAGSEDEAEAAGEAGQAPSDDERPARSAGQEPGGDAEAEAEDDEDGGDEEGVSTRRRRRRRRAGAATGDAGEDAPNVSTRIRQPRGQSEEPVGVKGSTRLEAKKQRRREGREAGRRRTIITEAEFLARREAVDRLMVVRNKDGRTQMGVLEDGVLVEHYIDQATTVSMAGNIYLGRIQNVLPSMEAAFVDIGKGRNAVLYAGEVNWDAAGLDANEPKRIENALTSGQTVLVQVTKDPIGHKGARLTSQISLPGRYLVYVPNSSMTGISRKLPDTERARLKKILRDVVPDSAGVIVRTAAEGASEEELRADVERLTKTWEDIQARAEAAAAPKGKSKGRKKNGGSGSSTSGSAPLLLHGEPDLTIRVIRDVFNEDFKQLVVSGEQAWNEIQPYITSVAPDLADRVTKWTSEQDLFTHHRVDEQLAKAMDRKVWLPSGGSLVIDRTEAMTVVDVNTGKFVGSGGNLEETVTKNNLEAAEEIVRQLRLRDIGGIIVIDFIDMVLESNRELVVRRLLECLGRDRTKHQVAEVTSLGLVQMTRKRVGSGLIEVFSETCEHCNGRGFIIHSDPVDKGAASTEPDQGGARSGRRGRRGTSAGGNGGNGQPQPEQTRPMGPTAAQIAAAAHAAALKSAAGVTTTAVMTAADTEPTDTEPTGTEPTGTEPTDTESVESRSPSGASEPAHLDGEVAPQPLPEDPDAEAGPGEPIAEDHSDTDADGAEPESDVPVSTPDAASAASAVDSSASRPRRRRGRVVAPAGPPRISSTDE